MRAHWSDWIRIDESKYVEANVQKERSVVVETKSSPYDVPHQIRSDFEPDCSRFVIEFQYIDDEPTKEVRVHDHVMAKVGKKSGRIYVLVMDVNTSGSGSLALEMNEIRQDASSALSSMTKRLETLRSAIRSKPKNYAVADKVLGDYWDTITEPLIDLP